MPRSLAACKVLWTPQLAIFKLYLEDVSRTMVSGWERQDVCSTLNVKLCTDMLWDANTQNRPAVCSPFTIDGGSAARRGQPNVFASKPIVSQSCTVTKYSDEEQENFDRENPSGLHLAMKLLIVQQEVF